MSRSRRRTPIFGHSTAESEAVDKRLNHQRERAHLRNALARTATDPDMPTPVIDRREVSNVATMDKDGKHYWSGATAKDMRK